MSAGAWSVSREVDYVDVVAEKDGLKVLAEAKGRTAAMGLDPSRATLVCWPGGVGGGEDVAGGVGEGVGGGVLVAGEVDGDLLQRA